MRWKIVSLPFVYVISSKYKRKAKNCLTIPGAKTHPRKTKVQISAGYCNIRQEILAQFQKQ